MTPGSLEVGERADLRVLGRHGEHELVGREHHRLLELALRGERVGQLRVRGGEHVDRHALADLRGELVRAGELEPHVGVGEVRRAAR